MVGDPERLAQVVDNLLSNALRYTDAGGQIEVSLAVRDGEAVVEVADSGIGIEPGQLERIFDRFWRSPEARARTADGSGVGLALVSDLVRVHDGRVAVASEPGRGTRLSVALPLHTDVATLSRRPGGTAVPERWRRRGDVGAAQPDAPVAG